jgi:hypothetical protein
MHWIIHVGALLKRVRSRFNSRNSRLFNETTETTFDWPTGAFEVIVTPAPSSRLLAMSL